MNPTLRKNITTHAIIILGFFAVTLISYHPYFLSGKTLSQHDILQAKGGNHQLIEHRMDTGEEALWMNTMFSGMPAYLNGVQYSGDLIKYIYQGLTLGLWHPAGIMFAGSICFYILLLAFRVRPWIAFIGALTFSLNGFNIISITAGHNSKIAAVALLPMIVAGVHLAFNDKKWLGFALTALGLAMQLRTGHFQITYYTVLIISMYGIFRLIAAFKSKEIKPCLAVIAGLFLAGIIGLGTNAGKLWTVYEYSKVSIRGKSELKTTSNQSSGLDRDYAFEYSNGIFEPLFLFIPNFFGGASTQELSKNSATAEALRKGGYGPAQVKDQIKSMPTYWGDQRLSAPYYAGSLVVVLFVIGLVVLRQEQKNWLVIIVCLGIILSWGSSFSAVNNFLFDYLPMYNKFRSVTFTIIITIFGLNLIAFQTLEALMNIEWNNQNTIKILKAAAVPAGFAFLMILGAGLLSYEGSIDSRLPEWLVSAIREDRASLLRKDALRALIFIISFSAVIWFYIKKKWSQQMVIGSIIILLFLDIFLLSTRFLKSDSFIKSPVESYFKPNAADKLILNNAESGDRVLNLNNPFNEARTSYFHESIGGYHGAKVRRYQDLIEKAISPEMSTLIGRLQTGKRDFSELPALNMLNTRFMMAGNTKETVLQNTNALGNAWIVNSVKAVNSPDEELASIKSFDPSQSAIIDQSQWKVPNISVGAEGTIYVLRRSPNEIVYRANVTGESLGVFSEIYYSNGWRAYLDDKEIEILRVNYLLRALPLTAGEHEIKFIFEPKSYFTGNTIALMCSLVTLIFLAFALVREIKTLFINN